MASSTGALLRDFVLVFSFLSPAVLSAEPILQLEINGILNTDNSESLVDAIDAMIEPSSAAVRHAGMDDTASSAEVEDLPQSWLVDTESGVAFTVTDEISLGVDYQIEELEELTAHHIKMGMAGPDHISHNVLLRAQWHFDVDP